jgi:ribosomal protein S18 acetylase RimI-like enzyme
MIRKLSKTDRPSLESMLKNTEEFETEEKEVALELIDEALNNEQQDYYNIFVYEKDETLLGYYCIGRRSLTDGVYDLYWIVVDSNSQNMGIGKQLLEHAEKYAENKKGRWILIETSSRDKYLKTRNFYLRNYFTQVAEIKDFYTVGDNLIIYGKYLIT